MKHLLLLLVGFCFPFIGFAQEAIVTGKITDAQSGEPLIAATIRAGEIGAVTDYDGVYRLDLPAGTHTLEVNYVGYQIITREVVLEAGEERIINFPMDQNATLLQTATVTSGKFERALSDVTVSLEVVRPDLIESINSVSVEDALEKVPGVTIIDGQANIRGGSGYSYGAGSRVLVLVDDIPIFQPDAGLPNWKDMPVENIEQMEVVKGAASALYGSSALNGIINIRTGYAKLEPEFKASLFHKVFMAPQDPAKKWWNNGPPSGTGGSLLYKRKFGDFDLVVSGFALEQQGHIEEVYETYKRFTFKTRYRLSDRLSFGLNGNFNGGEKNEFFFFGGYPEGFYRGSDQANTFTKRFRYSLDPFITYFDGIGNRHKVFGRFFSVDNQSNNNQSNQSELYYGEYQFQRNMTGLDLVTTAGVVVSGTYAQAELYGEDSFNSINYAGYLQLEKEFADRLNISAGFRYEQNRLNTAGNTYIIGRDTVVGQTQERESKPVFRLGANLKLAEATFFRTSIGQGYRYPTIAEKYVQTTFGSNINISPNPNLQSETGWSAEMGIKQGFRLFSFEGFLDVSGFWSEYQNMMEFNFVDLFIGFQSRNIGNTIIGGAEITVAGRGEILGVSNNLFAGYTYIDPRFADFDQTGQDNPPTQGQENARLSSADYNVLKYRARHQMRFDWQSDFKKLSVGVGIFYNSEMEAVDAAFLAFIGGIAESRKNLKGFELVNIRVAYNFTENRKVSFLVENLFNEEYTIRPGLSGPMRSISVRLDYSF